MIAAIPLLEDLIIYFPVSIALKKKPPATPQALQQELISTAVGEEIVDEALQGLDTCVFMYGATSSGKTYTLLGTTECPGFLFWIAEHLLEKLEVHRLS